MFRKEGLGFKIQVFYCPSDCSTASRFKDSVTASIIKIYIGIKNLKSAVKSRIKLNTSNKKEFKMYDDVIRILYLPQGGIGIYKIT